MGTSKGRIKLRRYALAGAVLAITLGAASLMSGVLAPTPAGAGAGGVSVTSSTAKIVVRAFDGGGPTTPVTRKAQDSGFS